MRRTKFERQLIDVLVLNQRGGAGRLQPALQAIEVVVKEMKPRFDEFRRVAREVGLGMSLGKALTNLSARMQNRDLDLW